ncbi:hypothetical protein F4777DRAFT_560563 [Nemania sp. FL0916]|nr:hypothetical protein F4777DRAFT_560563 [Nemania sp. FL0916]
MADVLIERFDNRVAVGLGNTLWSWQRCDACKTDGLYQSTSCSSRVSRANRYFNFYTGLLLDYHEASPPNDRPFKTHGDIWNAISLLAKHPELTRADFSERILVPASKSIGESLIMQATALVVKIVCMTDCSNLYYSTGRLEEGSSGAFWENQIPFNKYLQDLFTVQNQPIWSSQHGQTEVLYERKRQLRATKLIKHLDLNLCPTHNIHDHLRLDTRRNELQIFHYASFLKENLRSQKGSPQVNLLPRQLLLEVLDSTQRILFPLGDAKSRKLLKSFIANKDYSFDPEIEKFELSAVCNPEENISYRYLANRLEDLFQELQSPKPRKWLEKQLQRRSSARYMMLATLAGVAFAILLGVLALILSSVQTWIAYQAWKHPVVTA